MSGWRCSVTAVGDVPERMAAAVLRGAGHLEVTDVPVPPVGPDDVLVQVELCGVCGSDLHMVMEGWGEPGTWHGHEWIGTVAAVGDQVARWHEGDRVIGGPPPSCGACEMCRVGRTSLCVERGTPSMGGIRGAFATYKVAAADDLLPHPEGLDPRAAALAEPLAVAVHAVQQGRAEPGQRVLVLGAGPIGALCIATLRAIGVDDVTCVEPNERRQALAAAVGAGRVLRPEDLVVPSIAEPALIVEGAMDLVLECSGNAGAMQAGLAQLVRGGRLVLVGAGIHPPRLDPNRIILNELVITGACEYGTDGYDRALELLSSGALPVDELLEPDEVGLDGLLDAMRDLAEGRRAGKVLVRP
jgi:2-desacetyl-2-hydroxyethyl bacteriochlorophyllide A dehydrogenase